MSDLTPYEMQERILRLENALVSSQAENNRLREALTIIGEHRRAPEWIKRIADAALAKEGQ